MIYASPSYQLGASQIGDITSREASKAEGELRKMRGSLKRWLKYRTMLGTPASDVTAVELRMGKRLHILLSEMFDAQSLPAPSRVLELAQIAVAGKLPTESPATAAGLFWIWPAVAVVGLVLMTLVVKIKSDADDAADARRIECIQAGRCTDYGFWLKVGGITVAAWVVWEKFGLKHKFKKAGG